MTPPALSSTSVFPSRSRQASASSSTSTNTTGPFPARVHRRASPLISNSPYLNTAPFPPPPATSPHARYLARARGTPLPPSLPTTPEITLSPSFASIASNLSVAQPVFPSLGAKLESDGIVRAGVANRRISRAPWDGGGSDDDDGGGDELDRMMRAQRRGELGRDRQATKARDRRRKSIHAELLKPKFPPNLADLPPLPISPLLAQEASFQRALLEADTVKKSLGSGLLSDSISSRRQSPIFDDNTPVDVLLLGDGESEGDVSIESGLTPSTSISSEISLPSFPDVPSHHNLRFPPPRAAPQRLHNPSIVVSDVGESLETLEENVFDACSVSGVDDESRAHVGLGFPVDLARTPPTRRTSSRASTHTAHIARSVSSDSSLSQFVDAVEEVSPSHGGLQETPLAPVTVPTLELARQQTSQWVLDTLASSNGVGRSLDKVKEEEGEGEEVEAIRHSRLYDASPLTIVRSESPTSHASHASHTSHTSQASSLPITPVLAAFPTTPQSSQYRPAGSGRTRELSGGSSISASSSTRQYRASSPAPSAGSRSSANSSAAAVSYTAPRRNAPTSSSGYVKPAKLTFGKKIGSLFSSSISSSNNSSRVTSPTVPGFIFGSSASSSGGGGISSRDIVISPNTMMSVEDDPFRASFSPPIRSVQWDARTSTSGTSGPTVEFRLTPPSLPTDRTTLTAGSQSAHSSSLAGESCDTEKENNRPPHSRSTASPRLAGGGTAGPKSGGGGGGLNDLLSRFEKEEKERIRGIARGRKTSSSALAQEE
ncbi:hypothetical protein JCM11641_002849 [Rhodosporidiobolus odoratus]